MWSLKSIGGPSVTSCVKAFGRGHQRLSRRCSTAVCSTSTTLEITTPDDWHLHLRDGDSMRSVVHYSAQHFARAIIMPNLLEPVTTVAQALEYKERIMSALPAGHTFQPLMTLYLTDNTPLDTVWQAKEAGILAFKLYPAGATTNSLSGVTDLSKVTGVIHEMAKAGVLLLLHGEVTGPHVDMFDREAEFIKTKLVPLLDANPDLKVVMEHVTTQDAVEFVSSAPESVAATITPQHILYNRNALFTKGLNPHFFCLPILKRERHREACLSAATSGSRKFFLGTDSAPHPKHAKESACGCAGVFSAPVALAAYAHAFEQVGALDKLEAFASFNGPDFYGLPRNNGTIKLVKEEWKVPTEYNFGTSTVVPLWAGTAAPWTVM